MMQWVVVALLVVALVTPLPFWWNIRLIDVVRNFWTKGLHIFKVSPLNVDTCVDNLFAFDDVMRSHGVPFWLSEGTALGCVRDNGFIPWDDDVDTGVACEHRERFISDVLPQLQKSGFVLTFVTNGSTFFGFFRNGEKLDVDFACQGNRCQACRTSFALCDTCDDMVMKLGLHSRDFMGRSFLVPGPEYLEYLYGPTWRTPNQKKDIMV